MASPCAAKALLLLQLSVLLLSSFTVLGDEVAFVSARAPAPHFWPSHAPAPAPEPHHHHHHHPKHPPSPPPAKTPAHPPVKPPVHPPVKPPTHPPSNPRSYPFRKYMAVQGVVFCKSCKYPGIDTLTGATPLVGAVVKIQCNNTKYNPVVEKATTDKNGYFFIMPKKVTTAASHKCKVFLVSSPSATCDVPTNLHAGSTGAILMPARNPPVPNPTTFELFNVGPFAFEPSKKYPCPR